MVSRPVPQELREARAKREKALLRHEKRLLSMVLGEEPLDESLAKMCICFALAQLQEDRMAGRIL